MSRPRDLCTILQTGRYFIKLIAQPRPDGDLMAILLTAGDGAAGPMAKAVRPWSVIALLVSSDNAGPGA